MTKDEALMAKWERLLQCGIEPISVFGTRDIREIMQCFHDVVIIKALRRNKYNISSTALELGMKSREGVACVAKRYVPEYRRLKRLATEMKRINKIANESKNK